MNNEKIPGMTPLNNAPFLRMVEEAKERGIIQSQDRAKLPQPSWWEMTKYRLRRYLARCKARY